MEDAIKTASGEIVPDEKQAVQWRKLLLEAGLILGFLLMSSWLVRP